MAKYILDVEPENIKFPEKPSGKLGVIWSLLCETPLGWFTPEILIGWVVNRGDKRLEQEISAARELQRARIEAGELAVTHVTVLQKK